MMYPRSSQTFTVTITQIIPTNDQVDSKIFIFELILQRSNYISSLRGSKGVKIERRKKNAYLLTADGICLFAYVLPWLTEFKIPVSLTSRNRNSLGQKAG